MGRTRKIADDAIIDAAEPGVLRGGTISPSIDAVTHDASIGEPRVVYNRRRKNTLLELAFVLQVAEEIERKSTFIEAVNVALFPELFDRVSGTFVGPKSGRDLAPTMLASAPTKTGSSEKSERMLKATLERSRGEPSRTLR